MAVRTGYVWYCKYSVRTCCQRLNLQVQKKHHLWVLEIRKTISNTYCSMGNFTLQSQKQVISVPFSLVGIKKAGNHFDSLHGVLLCFCVVLMITCLYKMLRKLVRRIRLYHFIYHRFDFFITVILSLCNHQTVFFLYL